MNKKDIIDDIVSFNESGYSSSELLETYPIEILQSMLSDLKEKRRARQQEALDKVNRILEVQELNDAMDDLKEFNQAKDDYEIEM